MKCISKHLFPLIILSVYVNCNLSAQPDINFGSLIEEITDMNRLTLLPEETYKTVQYSSYDRRSRIPGMEGWFANSDGFGGEPIPGFEKMLSQPGETGIGTWLICDVKGPGAILRLWTARINGTIRLFLDDQETPVYSGSAEELFWNTAPALSKNRADTAWTKIFRQYDASYFPVPFSKRCRIEWTGDISKLHFYHVEIRKYSPGTVVETFKPDVLLRYEEEVESLRSFIRDLESGNLNTIQDSEALDTIIPARSTREIFTSDGPMAIDHFSVKVKSENPAYALRNTTLLIYFDDAAVPQVAAPLGDFFGAAPGINPYHSFPFSVTYDSAMICRFVMPYEHSVRVLVENHTNESLALSGQVHASPYTWREGRSMHFRARWKMDQGLTASNVSIMDIPYYSAFGKGRIVGAAAFLYNPSKAVTSWGNWWGEGDEKIFIDNDTFPSFFGTGTEDYFNYSWSSERIFSYPYCGQPRNDGPGNRGYVSNFRWHINDDLLFNEKISFKVELYHHGRVPDFSYGRIVYAYAISGIVDDYMPVTERETHTIPYHDWEPVAYLGSAGYSFFQAEEIVMKNPLAELKTEEQCSGKRMLFWNPDGGENELKFLIKAGQTAEYTIGFTLVHMPLGGEISASVNGKAIKLNGRESVDLKESGRIYLRNYFSEPILLNAGENDISLDCKGTGTGSKVGVDFIWLKEK